MRGRHPRLMAPRRRSPPSSASAQQHRSPGAHLAHQRSEAGCACSWLRLPMQRLITPLQAAQLICLGESEMGRTRLSSLQLQCCLTRIQTTRQTMRRRAQQSRLRSSSWLRGICRDADTATGIVHRSSHTHTDTLGPFTAWTVFTDSVHGQAGHGAGAGGLWFLM